MQSAPCKPYMYSSFLPALTQRLHYGTYEKEILVHDTLLLLLPDSWELKGKIINLLWQFLVEFMHAWGYVYERHSNWVQFYIEIVYLIKSQYFSFLFNTSTKTQVDQTHTDFEII